MRHRHHHGHFRTGLVAVLAVVGTALAYDLGGILLQPLAPHVAWLFP